VLAAHSSLAAAEARYRAICHLRGLAVLERDYQVRKEQSCLGVHIAESGLAQARADAVYCATRTYLGVLYAREQMQLATDVNKRLKDMQNATEVNPKVFTDNHKVRIKGYLGLVSERREDAVAGEKRALAALREAIGATDDCHLQVAPAPLPDLPVTLCCDELVAMAVTRRGDLQQANLAVALTVKEVDAQRKHFFPKAPTFAMGGDIHSRQVPEPNYGTEYAPGAIPPEMPPFLVGWRKGRVDTACALESKASYVADKARNLIVLETQEHFFRLEENLAKVESLKKSFGDMQKDLNDEMKKLDEGGKANGDILLSAGELTTQMRLDLNTARYQYLLELAALERVTAGGYCPGFETILPPKP
jgi:outer membrane protein TolC